MPNVCDSLPVATVTRLGAPPLRISTVSREIAFVCQLLPPRLATGARSTISAFDVALHPEPPVVRVGRRFLGEERVVVEKIRQRSAGSDSADRQAVRIRSRSWATGRSCSSVNSIGSIRSAPDLVCSPGAQRDVERVQQRSAP